MSLDGVVHTPRGIATVVLECVSYAAMLPFLYMEYRTIVEYWDDWLNAWNAIDVLVYSLQVILQIQLSLNVNDEVEDSSEQVMTHMQSVDGET